MSVNHRQIAATRNSGGRAAQGDFIFFIDADTTVNPRAVSSALRAMQKGAVGGGAPTWLDWNEVVPLYIRIIACAGVVACKPLGFTGGAFMFCTRAAFQATGGFNERFFWGEEGGFALALKQHGSFVGLWTPVLTSGRRFRKTSAWQLFLGGVRMVFSPIKMFTQRSSVEKIWYDSNRADDDKAPNSLVARLSNAIAAVVIILMFTGPLWNFVPRSLTPPGTPLGHMRLAIGVLLCHIGLLFWPFAVILLGSLLRRKHWLEWIRLAALGAFCVWQASGATSGVIWFWPWLGRALVRSIS